jgi:hypothetical protein
MANKQYLNFAILSNSFSPQTMVKSSKVYMEAFLAVGLRWPLGTSS